MSQTVKSLAGKNSSKMPNTNFSDIKQNVSGTTEEDRKPVSQIDSKHLNISNIKLDSHIPISKMKSVKICKGKDEILREEENALDKPQSKANNAMMNALGAQVKNLKEEIAKLVQELVIKEDTILSLQERLKEVETHHTEMQCKNALNEKNITKLQKALDDATKNCETKTQELSSAKLEVENLTRRHKNISVASSNLEKKLTEKLACNEKLKKELNQCKASEKTQQECAQRKIEDLISVNKNLQKENADLHNVIKKQMQLINNLKRQKMHSEAAISLKITEEEFMKALDATPAIFRDT